MKRTYFMAVIDRVLCLGMGACCTQTRVTFQSSRLTRVTLWAVMTLW